MTIFIKIDARGEKRKTEPFLWMRSTEGHPGEMSVGYQGVFYKQT